MKKLPLLFVLLVLFFSFSGCEKDDICTLGTPTTPNLIVTFYDINNPNVVKNIENVLLIAETETTGILYNGVSSIKIPLKTNTDQTKYSLFKKYDSEKKTFENEDIITINYTREDIFLSRACGFSTFFTLDTTDGFVVTNDGDNWLTTSEIISNTIVNEKNAHIKIFH